MGYWGLCSAATQKEIAAETGSAEVFGRRSFAVTMMGIAATTAIVKTIANTVTTRAVAAVSMTVINVLITTLAVAGAVLMAVDCVRKIVIRDVVRLICIELFNLRARVILAL